MVNKYKPGTYYLWEYSIAEKDIINLRESERSHNLFRAVCMLRAINLKHMFALFLNKHSEKPR